MLEMAELARWPHLATQAFLETQMDTVWQRDSLGRKTCRSSMLTLFLAYYLVYSYTAEAKCSTVFPS